MVQKVRPIIKRFMACAFFVHWLGMRTFGLDPIAILAPSDVPPGFGTGFGASVAISGDYIAIGAPVDPWNNGNSLGAVYVFRRVGPNWVEQAKLTASDGQYLDQLGSSVDMEGDVIVAGAPAWEATACAFRRQGAAYVFQRDDAGTPDNPSDDTWTQRAKLTAPLAEHGSALGFSVAISGDTIVVGSECGESAEVFGRIGVDWVYQISLVDPDPDEFHEFGSAVDTDGVHIVVGSYGYNERRGAAHVFDRNENGWTFSRKLENPEAQEWDDFARSVAVCGDFIVVGAPNEDLLWPQSSSGAAYLFEHGNKGWGEHEKLIAPDAHSSVYFGWAVAIDNDTLLIPVGIGASGFLFERGPLGWIETTQLVETKDSPDVCASIDGQYAVISTRVYVVWGRKNISDFAAFQNCFGSPQSTSNACKTFDFDSNGIVDIYDFGEVMAVLGGP